MESLLVFLRMHILLRGILYALSFYFIETIFRRLFPDDPQAEYSFQKSTLTMMPGSALAGLYFFEPFYRWCRPFGVFWWDLLLRLALWPVVIWLFEICWGWYLYHQCNKTRAWHYRGRGSYINGYVKTTYYGWWLILAVFIEIFFYYLKL